MENLGVQPTFLWIQSLFPLLHIPLLGMYTCIHQHWWWAWASSQPSNLLSVIFSRGMFVGRAPFKKNATYTKDSTLATYPGPWESGATDAWHLAASGDDASLSQSKLLPHLFATVRDENARCCSSALIQRLADEENIFSRPFIFVLTQLTFYFSLILFSFFHILYCSSLSSYFHSNFFHSF